MEEIDNRNERRAGLLRDKERFDLVAHFPSSTKARTAERAIGMYGAPAEAALDQPTEAPAISGAPTLGFAAWVGLLAGALVGAAVGLLVYNGILAVGTFGPAESTREPTLTFLWVLILGAAGWVAGAAWHIFSSPRRDNIYEVRVVVDSSRLAEAKQKLVEEGATEVFVQEHVMA